MKVNLHLPKFRFTKHLLIILGIAIVAGIVLLGAAESYHLKQVADNQAQHDAQVQAAKDKQTQAVIDELKAQNATLQANVNASCAYLNSLTANRATKSLVIVPTASGCPFPKQ